MDLLRNYQIKKQLGLIDSPVSCAVYDRDDLRTRISDSYRRVFGVGEPRGMPKHMQLDTDSRSNSFTRAKSGHRGSDATPMEAQPGAKSSIVAEGDKSGITQIRSLQEELFQLRDQNSVLIDRVKYLANQAVQESAPERVLHRINVSSPKHSSTQLLERKLEIYRQQIFHLTEERDRLRQAIDSSG
jgi:hypothetical protein